MRKRLWGLMLQAFLYSLRTMANIDKESDARSWGFREQAKGALRLVTITPSQGHRIMMAQTKSEATECKRVLPFRWSQIH